MIGFIGGTGPEGRGLALRLAMGGHRVMIGSRDIKRAQSAAQEIRNLAPRLEVIGEENQRVAHDTNLVFIVVPYAGHREVLDQLREPLIGKTVVDVVAPLTFFRGYAKAISVAAGSAAEEAQSILPASRVVAAFHNISAHLLLQPDTIIDCDVVVCSDDPEAKREVMDLAELIRGVRAIDGDRLECARYLENLTALLINVNRIYKGHSMIRITGIE
jgi:NADPH-dependent F420 reductase